MRTITLPGTGFPVSILALGAADFGSATPQDAAYACLDRFAEAGGNHLDTAHIYAAWLRGGWGASERLIGRWIRSRGLADRMAVGTKGCHFALVGDQSPRVRPDCIRLDLRDSLERLGASRVAIYYLHRDDPRIGVDELLSALEEERAAGRIGAYAASNWSAARLEEARRCAASRGWQGFTAHQVQWSLAEVPAEGWGGTRAVDATLRIWHRRHNLPISAYSAQANGFFARSWTWPATAGHEDKFARYLTAANVARWDAVKRRAAARGVSRNQLALAWLLNQPQPVWPVIGARTPAQVADSCAADGLSISPGELADLERGTPA